MGTVGSLTNLMQGEMSRNNVRLCRTPLGLGIVTFHQRCSNCSIRSDEELVFLLSAAGRMFLTIESIENWKL
jgi:hypothetical protein